MSLLSRYWCENLRESRTSSILILLSGWLCCWMRSSPERNLPMRTWLTRNAFAECYKKWKSVPAFKKYPNSSRAKLTTQCHSSGSWSAMTDSRPPKNLKTNSTSTLSFTKIPPTHAIARTCHSHKKFQYHLLTVLTIWPANHMSSNRSKRSLRICVLTAKWATTRLSSLWKSRNCTCRLAWSKSSRKSGSTSPSPSWSDAHPAAKSNSSNSLNWWTKQPKSWTSPKTKSTTWSSPTPNPWARKISTPTQINPLPMTKSKWANAWKCSKQLHTHLKEFFTFTPSLKIKFPSRNSPNLCMTSKFFPVLLPKLNSIKYSASAIVRALIRSPKIKTLKRLTCFSRKNKSITPAVRKTLKASTQVLPPPKPTPAATLI